MKIFIVRKDEKVAVSTQDEAAADWGADRVVYVDRKDHANAHYDIRPDTIVGVYRLDLLAARGKRAKKRARESLLDYMSHVFRHEGKFFEYISGRSCDDKAELLQMYQEACDRFIKGYRSNQPSGRPKTRTYADDEALWIDAMWHDRRHSNNASRIEAIKARFPKFNQAAWYDPNLQNQIKNLKEQTK